LLKNTARQWEKEEKAVIPLDHWLQGKHTQTSRISALCSTRTSLIIQLKLEKNYGIFLRKAKMLYISSIIAAI
jgi:hypothetical protein